MHKYGRLVTWVREEMWEGRRLDGLLWELGNGNMWRGLKITCVDLGQCDDTRVRMVRSVLTDTFESIFVLSWRM